MKRPERVFIAGVSGLLGLNAALQWRGRFDIGGCYHCHPIAIPGLTLSALDLEDRDSVHTRIGRFRPDAILHAAGFADVDRCERDARLAARLNVDVARNVAEVARATGARLVHISTDQLFAGNRSFHTETAEPSSLNVYARTKLEAERVVQDVCPDALVVRTNFVGWGTSDRKSFLDWVVRSLESHAPLRMFTDVFTTPIAVNDLLDSLAELLDCGATGILNIAGGERLSKYELGVRIARAFGYAAEQVEPCGRDDIPHTAIRPRDMSLSTERVSALLGRAMPATGDMLERLKRLREAGWSRALQAAMHSLTPTAPDRLSR